MPYKILGDNSQYSIGLEDDVAYDPRNTAMFALYPDDAEVFVVFRMVRALINETTNAL